jgi:hypothetical protein
MSERDQLDLIVCCDPQWLIEDVRHNTAFDANLLEVVFALAKERAGALLAASEERAKPVAYIAGADEYGPKLLWKTHWVDLIGESLYTCPVTSRDDTAHLLSTEANAVRLRSSLAQFQAGVHSDFAALHLTPQQALADAKGAE